MKRVQYEKTSAEKGQVRTGQNRKSVPVASHEVDGTCTIMRKNKLLMYSEVILVACSPSRSRIYMSVCFCDRLSLRLKRRAHVIAMTSISATMSDDRDATATAQGER